MMHLPWGQDAKGQVGRQLGRVVDAHGLGPCLAEVGQGRGAAPLGAHAIRAQQQRVPRGRRGLLPWAGFLIPVEVPVQAAEPLVFAWQEGEGSPRVPALLLAESSANQRT